MTRRYWMILCGLVLFGLGLAGTSQARAESRETATLVLHWDPDRVPAEIVDRAVVRGEELLAQVVSLLGEEFRPQRRVPIYLHGPADSRKGEAPRVDVFGNVHLYQYGPHADSHLSPLAHELVHAVRNPHLTGRDNFLEEGLASWVALQLEPTRPGFPFYNFEVDVVAGQWLGTEYEVSLVDLAHEHKRWNMPCRVQSYSLRASFFAFLAAVDGGPHLVRFAENSRDGTWPDYESWFGAPLPELAAQWRAGLWERYHGNPDSAQQTQAFWSGPAQWTPPCDVTEQVERRDSPEDPADGDLTIRVEELWRVGADPEDHLLGVISRVRVGATGEVYLLDEQLSHVCVFSSAGAFLRTLGGPGEGPGEFRHPTDLVLLDDGTVGVVEVIPANIEFLTPEGTVVNRPFEIDSGSFGELYRAEAVGSTLVVAGSRSGKDSRTRYLATLDPAGVVKDLHTETHASRYGNMAYEEATYVGFQRRWAITSDQVAVLAPSFDRYQLDYRPIASGLMSRTVNRPGFPRAKRSSAEEAAMRRVYGAQTSWNPNSTFAVSGEHESILEIFARDEGAVWVLSSQDWDQPEPVAGLDEFDRHGAFTRSILLEGDIDPRVDGLHFHDELLFVVKRQFDAMLAAAGGSDGREAGSAGEVEVVCYRMLPEIE